MRVIQAEDYEKMARAIVDDYLESSTPMETNIVKVALNDGLNPDQIKNLVNVSNVMAHMTLFNKKAEDKVIEFTPADPASVLQSIYKNAEPLMEEPAVSDAEPYDRVSDLFGNISELVDKVKDMAGQSSESPVTPPDGENVNTETETLAPRKKQMLIIKIRKVANYLKDQKMQHAYEYKEKLAKLASEFAKLYGPDYDSFEKDAVSARGATGLPILADIRCCLRMPQLETNNLVKTARVVDTDTSQMKSFDELLKLAQQYNDISTAYDYIEREYSACLR